MKIISRVATALLALASLPALAADQTVDLSSGSASFIGTGPLLVGGDDVISFINLAAGTYDFSFTLSAQNVGGLGATVNSQPATVFTLGVLSFAGAQGTSASPFTVLISGVAGAKAAYSGELTVTAVPEPGAWALMLAGLASIGLVARRRG